MYTRYICDDSSINSDNCRLYMSICFFFFQAEDGIRDLVRSRGLGDVYKRQLQCNLTKMKNIDMVDSPKY